VGPWVREKHARLEKYIGISRAVRKKFVGPGNAGATYIDLFCGPGRARIKDTNEVVHGSPLVAWHASVSGGAPFTQIHIADADSELLRAAEFRLNRADAPVFSEVGQGFDTVDRVLAKLDRYALHFAFLDPFNLDSLSFEIIRKLAQLKHMDILIHVSVQDMQRNLDKYVAMEGSPLDSFAPGWRDHVDVRRPQSVVRTMILEHWRNLLRAEGMTAAETFEKVTGPSKQPLYWLAFAAKHDLPLEFWEKIVDISTDGQRSLF
jgi:three-Cys-motif partner protein